MFDRLRKKKTLCAQQVFQWVPLGSATTEPLLVVAATMMGLLRTLDLLRRLTSPDSSPDPPSWSSKMCTSTGWAGGWKKGFASMRAGDGDRGGN
jgi:hypothetical protein